MIHLVIQGKAIAQPRHRAGLNKATGRPVMYGAETDHDIWTWRDRIAQEIARAMKDIPAQHLNPAIAYELVMPRAKKVEVEGIHGTGRRLKKGEVWPAPSVCGGPGDVDNLLKPFMDVGNDCRIWPDDGRVWCIVGGMKRVASGDRSDPPRADVTIWDASELTQVVIMEWWLEHWPREWDERTAYVRREK